MTRLLLALMLALLLPAAGRAEKLVTVRTSSHPGFGRLVFAVPPGTGFKVMADAGRITIAFTGTPSVAIPPDLPRNVLAMEKGAGSTTLTLAAGARLRSSRAGNRIVVEVLDPSGAAAQPGTRNAAGLPQKGVTPSGAEPTADTTRPPNAGTAAAPAQAVEDPTRPAPQSAPEPAQPPPPAQTALLPMEPRRAVNASSLVALIPFDVDTGVAAFRRGDRAVIVFDQRTPLDLARIQGVPGFADAAVAHGMGSTVLSVAMPAEATPSFTRVAAGWLLGTTPPVSGAGAELSGTPQHREFGMQAPGKVVSILDPATEQPLLVGTTKLMAGPGVAQGQRAPEYSLVPTWMGVVVEPVSDQVALRATQAGFTLTLPALATTAQDNRETRPDTTLTRRFDFPDLPMAGHLHRLDAQVAGAATAPPRARARERFAAAQSMVSLGLATEAQAVLTLLATEDAAYAASPDVAGLTAIAAMLAGRLAEADGIDDLRLDGSDEIELWRGIRKAWQGRDADAGRLPRLVPLVLAYPEALRARLLPTVAEIVVQHGPPGVVAGLLAQRSSDPALDFARALQRERDGDTDAALAAFDALATSRNGLLQVRAVGHAAELRFRSGRADAASTADTLERQVLAWRGDDREIALRLRIAELRAASGAWRAALEGLRDTGRVMPGGAGSQQIAARVGGVFRAMLAPGSAGVPPLDLVALASEFADKLPDGDDGVALQTMLADKLGALDLPARARPVLQSLMLSAPAGPVRAGLGASLAQTMLDAGEAEAAQAVLAQSDAPELPPTLREQRGLVLARVHASQGHTTAAATVLAALATPAADDLRARLLERAGDWPGSLTALNDLVGKAVPADGPLTGAMQDLVLRQAGAAVQATDAAVLARLNRTYLARMTPPRLDLFRLLTAAPVAGSKDIERAGAEMALARAVPSGLDAMTAR